MLRRRKFSGAWFCNTRTPIAAPANPKAPPRIAISAPSVTNCRSSRSRLAPIAERTANSFCRFAVRAKLQVRDIHARNQQHHSHRNQQNQQRRANITHKLAVQRDRHHLQTLRACERASLACRRQFVCSAPSSLPSPASTVAPGFSRPITRVSDMPCTFQSTFRRELKRGNHVRVESAKRISKRCRHHADDRVAVLVQRDSFPNDVRIGIELSSPERVASGCTTLGRIRQSFFGREPSARVAAALPEPPADSESQNQP